MTQYNHPRTISCIMHDMNMLQEKEFTINLLNIHRIQQSRRTEGYHTVELMEIKQRWCISSLIKIWNYIMCMILFSICIYEYNIEGEARLYTRVYERTWTCLMLTTLTNDEHDIMMMMIIIYNSWRRLATLIFMNMKIKEKSKGKRDAYADFPLAHKAKSYMKIK